MDMLAARRILYIQPRPFGDVLCNTGVLPYLRRAVPRARIDYLVEHPFEQVLAGNPNVDELVVIRPWGGMASVRERIAVMRDVRRRRYDLVIDQMCGTFSAQVVLASGAPLRLGFADSRRRLAYNVRAVRGPERYSAAMKFDVLAPLGITEGPYALEYTIALESQQAADRWLDRVGVQPGRFVCVAPGSKDPRKCWRPTYFAQVCDALQAATSRAVVLMGAPDERQVLDVVGRAMATTPVVAPACSLNQAVALLSRARLLVCNDTALNHFSAVTRTPSLAMFGPSSSINWSPDTDPHHHFLHHPERFRRGDDSFGITPDEAVVRALEILDTIEGLGGRTGE